jgi:hypothetical protein
MSCCLGFKRSKIPKQNKGLTWNFSNGSTVISDSFVTAINELERVNSRDFWASETNDGIWDVQLSDAVIVQNIKAESVTEAVRIARWKSYLDKSFKKLHNCSVNNVL